MRKLLTMLAEALALALLFFVYTGIMIAFGD
jgi:hypothetical protein